MRIRARWLDWMLAAAVVLLCRLLFRTLRIQYLAAGNTNPYCPRSTEGFIYSVWHDSMAFPLFAGRHQRTVALVSRHQDGTHLAAGLKMLGIGLVRGSTNRDGASAMRHLLRLSDDTRIVMTPDGPRGPRRQVKRGLIFLAMHSGRAIVPTGFAAARTWKIPGGWSDLAIPKPFTRAYALSGEAIRVPTGATAADLEAIHLLVQAEMDRLNEQAQQLAANRATNLVSPAANARQAA